VAETVISGKYAAIGCPSRMIRADHCDAVEILARLGCEHLAKKRWGCLSQGERQCIGIGRALMAKPRLLILDEPCAGLDPVAREDFLEFLEQTVLRQIIPAIVLVTHHVEEVSTIFSHVLLLRQGRVVAQGKTGRILLSSAVSRAFGPRVEVRRAEGRYSMKVASRTLRS